MEAQNIPPSLPVINPNATAKQMIQLRHEGATFEPACANLRSESLGWAILDSLGIMKPFTNSLITRQLLDHAHQPIHPNMTDKEPHMGKASLVEQEDEAKKAWNDKVSTIQMIYIMHHWRQL